MPETAFVTLLCVDASWVDDGPVDGVNEVFGFDETSPELTFPDERLGGAPAWE